MDPSSQATVPRFLGLSGGQLRRVGAVLFAAGLLLFIGAPIVWILAIQGVFDTMLQDPFSPPTGFPSVTTAFIVTALMGFGGILLMGLGAFALRFGLVRPATGYVVAEAAPAVEAVSAAVGRSLRDAAAPSVARPEVRVKCRNCGYLETEDATYCSSCGRAI